MPYLRQSTSQVIRFGPCLDKGDGVTEETALTLAQADMRLSKDGGAFAQKNAAGNATHDSDGWYSTTLNATDTDTVGELRLNVHQPANMLPVWDRWWVLEEAIYDAIFGASASAFIAAGVNVAQISGDTTAADNLETMLDGTGGATLSLGQLNIVASGGNSAIVATGDGAGHGILATGGGTNGSGIKCVGGATNGHGIEGVGAGTGAGVKATGGATGHGIWGDGGATSGNGLYCRAQTSGNGFAVEGAGTGKAGMKCTGGTNSDGLALVADGTGNGLDAIGGSNGHAIFAQSGGGAKSGIYAEGGATGYGIEAKGGYTSGAGIRASGEAGNSVGFECVGIGSEAGIKVTAGATGNGVTITGGATSGDAINASATSGAGLNLSAGGSFADLQANGIFVGTVDNTAFTATTTEFECDDIAEATADHYKDRVAILPDGQAKPVTAYSLTGGRGHFTVDALVTAPADNDVVIFI